MKTLADVRRWAGRLQQLFQMLHDADQRVVDCELRLEQAEESGAARQLTKWQTEVEYAQSQVEIIERRLFVVTRQSDRDTAFQLLIDVSVRIELVTSLYEDWRATLAHREVLVHTELTQGESEEMDQEIQAAEQQCQLREAAYQRGMGLLFTSIPVSARAK